MNTVPITPSEVFQTKKRQADTIVFLHEYRAMLREGLKRVGTPEALDALYKLDELVTVS